MKKSKEDYSELLELLTPGSVWIQKSGRKRQLIVIAISNKHVSDEVKAYYPPQVFYLDEEGRIAARPVKEFIKLSDFFNVNPAIEKAVIQMKEYVVTKNTIDSIEIEDFDEEDLNQITNLVSENLFKDKAENQVCWFVGKDDLSEEDKIKINEMSLSVIKFEQKPNAYSDNENLTYRLQIDVDILRVNKLVEAYEVSDFFYDRKIIGLKLEEDGELIPINYIYGVYPYITKENNLINIYAEYYSDNDDYESFSEQYHLKVNTDDIVESRYDETTEEIKQLIENQRLVDKVEYRTVSDQEIIILHPVKTAKLISLENFKQNEDNVTFDLISESKESENYSIVESEKIINEKQEAKEAISSFLDKAVDFISDLGTTINETSISNDVVIQEEKIDDNDALIKEE